MIAVMGHEESLGSGGCVHYLDCSNGFTVDYVLECMWFYTVNMCNLLYLNFLKTKKSIRYLNFSQ